MSSLDKLIQELQQQFKQSGIVVYGTAMQAFTLLALMNTTLLCEPDCEQWKLYLHAKRN
jgi:hypothetical protein